MSYTVAQLEAQKQVTTQAYKSGQITQSGYMTWMSNQDKLIAEARAREAQTAQTQTAQAQTSQVNQAASQASQANQAVNQAQASQANQASQASQAASQVNQTSQAQASAQSFTPEQIAQQNKVANDAFLAGQISRQEFADFMIFQNNALKTAQAQTGSSASSAADASASSSSDAVNRYASSLAVNPFSPTGMGNPSNMVSEAEVKASAKQPSTVDKVREFFLGPPADPNAIVINSLNTAHGGTSPDFARSSYYDPFSGQSIPKSTLDVSREMGFNVRDTTENNPKALANTLLFTLGVGAGVAAPLAAGVGAGVSVGASQGIKTGMQLYRGEPLSLLSPSEVFYAGTTGAVFGGVNQGMGVVLGDVGNSWVREAARAGGNALLGGSMSGLVETGMTGGTSVKTFVTGAAIAGGISLGVSGATAASHYMPTYKIGHNDVPIYDENFLIGGRRVYSLDKISPEKTLFGTAEPQTSTKIIDIFHVDKYIKPAPRGVKIINPVSGGGGGYDVAVSGGSYAPAPAPAPVSGGGSRLSLPYNPFSGVGVTSVSGGVSAAAAGASSGGVYAGADGVSPVKYGVEGGPSMPDILFNRATVESNYQVQRAKEVKEYSDMFQDTKQTVRQIVDPYYNIDLRMTLNPPKTNQASSGPVVQPQPDLLGTPSRNVRPELVIERPKYDPVNTFDGFLTQRRTVGFLTASSSPMGASSSSVNGLSRERTRTLTKEERVMPSEDFWRSQLESERNRGWNLRTDDGLSVNAKPLEMSDSQLEPVNQPKNLVEVEPLPAPRNVSSPLTEPSDVMFRVDGVPSQLDIPVPDPVFVPVPDPFVQRYPNAESQPEFRPDPDVLFHYKESSLRRSMPSGSMFDRYGSGSLFGGVRGSRVNSVIRVYPVATPEQMLGFFAGGVRKQRVSKVKKGKRKNQRSKKSKR